jgi:SAM-dependent methyltransferase
MAKVQVTINNYNFGSYYFKGRWCSLWHQVDELSRIQPSSVLEVGPGLGILKNVADLFNIPVHTVDFANDLKPDFIAEATNLPFADAQYDCVCAFQMLEHLPYERSLIALREMIRISREHVLISLPDARSIWMYQLHLPYRGRVKFSINKPFWRPHEHAFDGEHYWEINTRGYPLRRILCDLQACGLSVIRTYRVFQNPFHRFFICQKDRLIGRT